MRPQAFSLRISSFEQLGEFRPYRSQNGFFANPIIEGPEWESERRLLPKTILALSLSLPAGGPSSCCAIPTTLLASSAPIARQASPTYMRFMPMFYVGAALDVKTTLRPRKLAWPANSDGRSTCERTRWGSQTVRNSRRS